MHARICFNSHLSVSEQLQRLGANVVSLDMSALRLGDYSIDDLEGLMSLIPNSVLYLNLGTNRLNKLSGDSLPRFFMSVTKTKVRYVSLHHNELGSVSTEVLLPAFSYLFDFLHALDLGYNEFWRKTSESWKCLFSSKPIKNLEYLNLSGNFLLTQGEELIEKMLSLTSLPVLRLSLAFNQIGEKKAEDVNKLFRAISPEIKVLDLQKNALHYFSVDTMSQLKGSLSFVTTLYMTSGELNRMSYEQLDQFAQIVPACNQVIPITRAHKIASSEKVDYLQNKLTLGGLKAHTQTNPLVDVNKHDMAMFLGATEVYNKLSKAEKVCSGLFSRICSLLEAQNSDYVVGCK